MAPQKDGTIEERLDLFQSFLADTDEHEMFVSGSGGSGKSYSMSKFLDVCKENEMPFMVVCYTHDACNVLRNYIYPKDPTGIEAMTNIKTLHSFLRKSPGINQSARRAQQLKCVNRHGKPKAPKILFLDEYSMIGDVDYMDIGELCTDDEGIVTMKTIYFGDSSQLPPVGQARAIFPAGNYQIELTKNWRLDKASQSLEPILLTLRQMISTSKVRPLPKSDLLHRKADIIATYVDMYNNGIDPKEMRVLAYTNITVYELNQAIHKALYGLSDSDGSTYKDGDWLFDSTLKQHIHLQDCTVGAFGTGCEVKATLLSEGYTSIQTNGKTTLKIHKDKWNTINKLWGNYDVYTINREDTKHLRFYMQGYVQWHTHKTTLEEAAVQGNIEVLKLYAENHLDTNLSDKEKIDVVKHTMPYADAVRNRARAWAEYLTFNQYVGCVDRPYASTVHKVQGRGYDYIFIEGTDMLKLYKRNQEEYLKLFYTAISRARKEIWISN